MSQEERSAAFLEMLERLHERHLVGVEGVREVWLIRHADAYTGIETIGPGVIDPPLSPGGREQAERLAARLADIGVDAVWSSDLRRAVETAQVVATSHGLEVRQDPRLREVRTNWDEGGSAPLGEPGQYPFPESEASVLARMTDFMKELVGGLRPDGRAVVVSHNAAIGIYVSGVLGLGWGKLPILPLYTSITILAAKDERVVVRSLADATHLLH
jgi:broad specificity phosphatase PhoE